MKFLFRFCLYFSETFDVSWLLGPIWGFLSNVGMFHYGRSFLVHLLGPIWGFLINVDVFHLGAVPLKYRWKSSTDSLNIDQNLFFRCIENQYESDEINDQNFAKSPTRGINLLALSTSRWEKNLVENIEDEII